MTDETTWDEARRMYERAVSLDPGYAPAWARLGYARRMLAKWGGTIGIGLLPHAEAAFKRAFELNPDLSIAHDLSAYAEAELGRAPEAMERLLRRAATRPADAGLLAGLVTTCRYAGLLDASRAAHQRAIAVDPAALTSVSWTYFLLGEYDTAIQEDRGSVPFCALISQIVKGELTADRLRAVEAVIKSPVRRLAMACYRYLVEDRIDEAVDTLEKMRELGFADPEGWYLYAFFLAQRGAREPALVFLTRSVDGGYGSHEPLTARPEWAPFRGKPEFDALVARTSQLVQHARECFDAADGAAVLAPREPSSSRVLGH
jgi:tetratricopeptide (TPR) repeat protein